MSEPAVATEAMGALKNVTNLLSKMQKQVGGAKKRLRRRTKRRRKSRKARRNVKVPPSYLSSCF